MAVSPDKQVLSIVGELIGITDVDQFCTTMLSALRAVVPSDWSSLNEVPANFPGAISITDPPSPGMLHEEFARYALQNPIAAHFIATGDGRATRFSDLVSARELHRLDIYREVYKPLGVEYQIAFTLPAAREGVLGATLSRSKHDFSDRERDLLNLARPYLIQCYRAVKERREADARQFTSMPLAALQDLGLSTRQAEVLRIVAFGRTAPDAARALGISPRTVQKHLELCYRLLGVRTRSEAATVAWAAVAGDAPA